MSRDSDSDEDGDFDQYSDVDAFDGGEVEVSPEDEEALAAFMVGSDSAFPSAIKWQHLPRFVGISCKPFLHGCYMT